MTIRKSKLMREVEQIIHEALPNEQVTAEMLETWLPPSQVAHRLHVTPQWVVILCQRGELPYIRTRLGRLIDPDAVDRMAVARQSRND